MVREPARRVHADDPRAPGAEPLDDLARSEQTARSLREAQTAADIPDQGGMESLAPAAHVDAGPRARHVVSAVGRG
jgi:hypothetical protein